MATAPVTVTANLNFNPASLNAAGKQVQSAFGNINLPTKSINAFNNSLGRITGQASEFDKSINAATARVFAFGAAVSIINGISTAFKSLVSSTIEVEKRLTEIGSILGGTAEQLGQFKNAIFDVAKNTGQTFATVADGASELARQGLSAEETVKRLNAALILTRVSGLDAEGSVNALTAAINGFTSAGLTAEQIVNKLIAVDTAFAVSAKDLAEAFSRAGSTAEDAGVSFDELLGLVTSVQQTTARGGAVIGNAFKSIFSRLSRGTVIEDLKALGVQIDSSQTGVQKLQALSDALAKISDPTQANAIKELAGGVYQINVVSAALKDLSSETSIFARASQTAGQASNEAFEKNAQLNQTLAAQINKLVQGLTELGSKIGELSIAPVIENLLTGANKLLDILNKVFDPEEGNKLIQGFFKGVGAFIAGPGLVLVSAAFFKLFQVVAKFAKEGISDLFKIGSEQERIKNIEGGIVALLQQDANLRAVLLSTSATQAQKEQAVINAIKQQNALLTQQQALVNSIAVASAKAGVGGYTPSGGFTNRGGKKRFAAAGYSGNVSPQEAAVEMSLASQNDYESGEVRKSRIFDGKGSSMMAIWNTAEKKKDFINEKGYRATLITPPNGFAASGFVPNFVDEDEDNGPLSKVKKNILDTYKNSSRDTNIRGVGTFSQAQIRAELERREKKKQKTKEKNKQITGTAEKRLDIKGDPYGFLVPFLGGEGQYSEQINQKLAIDKGKNTGVNFNLTGLDVRGPLLPAKELEGAKKRRLDISEKIKREVVKAAVSYSRPITSALGNPIVEKSGIEKLFAQSGGEGRQGAYGALQGVIGSAFEAAVVAAVGGSEAAPEGDNFDVNTANKDIDTIFFGGQGKKLKYDFKVSNSQDNVRSFASKIINDSVVYQDKLKDFFANRAKNKKAKSAASGFIPNFNSLNKGIPVNKIRAHFDDMGNPVAVTNTRDEPNGLKDAIGRERKGIGMAAGGFVPNFVFGGVGGSPQAATALAANAAALMSQLPALKASTAAATAQAAASTAAATASKAAATATKNVSSRFERMSGAIGALSSAYYFVGIPAIESIARAYALDEEALKNETDARDKAVKALENEKRKGEKANKDLITKLTEEVTARNEAITKMNEAANNFASKTSDISNIIANGAFILNLIPFGKIKSGFASLAAGRIGQFVARPLAGAGVAAAGGGGATVTSIAAGGALTIGAAAAAAIGTAVAGALIGVGIGKIIKENVTDPIRETMMVLPGDIELVKAQIESIDFDIENIEGDIQNYKKGLFELNQVFFFGYDQVKLVTKNIRSEFQKLNDDIGITGFNSKISQSESADRLASSAQDVVTAQNLKRTRNPFEQQNIVREREIARASEASSKGQRERASAAQVLKTGQEDFLTGISKYLNQAPSLQEIGRDVVINKAGDIGGPPDLREATKPITDILAGSKVPAFETARAIENTTVKGQENLSEAIKRVTDASENLKNSTSSVDASGKIVSNQDANLKEFLNAQEALKPLLQERAKQQGGEEGVEALNEEFQKYTESVKSSVEAQTQSFIKENEERERINLDSLVKQKEVLDQFVDNFNATFLQNAERASTLIAEAFDSGSSSRINENINYLGGANLGTGMASGETFLRRQESLSQTISQLESSGFFENVGTANDQAKFRSDLAGQLLGGGQVTALQGALGAQSGILQQGTKTIADSQQNRAAVGGAAVTAFKPILEQIRQAAIESGDSTLTQDLNRRISTLNDPRSSVEQLTAAGNVNLEGTGLSDAAQTEFQKSLISATGGVQSVINSLKGLSVATESENLGKQIEGVAEKLTTLQEALKVTVDDVTLPTVIKEFTTSTEGLTPVVDAFKTKITELEKALSEKVASVADLTKKEQELRDIQNNLSKEFALNTENVGKALFALVSPIGTVMVAYEKVTAGLEAAAKRAELIASMNTNKTETASTEPVSP
jgi:TP901 family phage tail tape measure protein